MFAESRDNSPGVPSKVCLFLATRVFIGKLVRDECWSDDHKVAWWWKGHGQTNVNCGALDHALLRRKRDRDHVRRTRPSHARRFARAAASLLCGKIQNEYITAWKSLWMRTRARVVSASLKAPVVSSQLYLSSIDSLQLFSNFSTYHFQPGLCVTLVAWSVYMYY